MTIVTRDDQTEYLTDRTQIAPKRGPVYKLISFSSFTPLLFNSMTGDELGFQYRIDNPNVH